MPSVQPAPAGCRRGTRARRVRRSGALLLVGVTVALSASSAASASTRPVWPQRPPAADGPVQPAPAPRPDAPVQPAPAPRPDAPAPPGDPVVPRDEQPGGGAVVPGAPVLSDEPVPGGPEVVARFAAPSSPAPRLVLPGANRCLRGEYGDVLPDGTVDAGCDGVLGLDEQHHPVRLRVQVDVLQDETASVLLDRRDLGGRLVRADAVSRRAGSVRERPLAYVAPDGLTGRDSFSVWVERDGYQREVDVVVDVVRRSGLVGVAPTRALLPGGAGTEQSSRFAAFDRATRWWAPPLVGAALLLVALALAWAAARRSGWRVPGAWEERGPGPPGGPPPASRTAFVSRR